MSLVNLYISRVTDVARGISQNNFYKIERNETDETFTLNGQCLDKETFYSEFISAEEMIINYLNRNGLVKKNGLVSRSKVEAAIQFTTQCDVMYLEISDGIKMGLNYTNKSDSIKLYCDGLDQILSRGNLINLLTPEHKIPKLIYNNRLYKEIL